jgi:hypothetical protein
MTIDPPESIRHTRGLITHSCPRSAGFLHTRVTRGS